MVFIATIFDAVVLATRDAIARSIWATGVPLRPRTAHRSLGQADASNRNVGQRASRRGGRVLDVPPRT